MKRFFYLNNSPEYNFNYNAVTRRYDREMDMIGVNKTFHLHFVYSDTMYGITVDHYWA